jgi:uncharacterized protein
VTQAIGALLLLQATPLPQPRGFVNDFADVIAAGDEARMDAIVRDVRAKSGGEIAIVTMPDAGELPASDLALRLGREWGVGAMGQPGDAQRNTGVVILLVPKETNSSGRGECRIEVGYGAEGFITDAMSGDICREATPRFAAGDYSGGLLLVTQRVADRFAREFGFTIDPSVRVAQPRQPRQESQPSFAPFLFMIILFILFASAGRRGRGGRGGGLGGVLPWIILSQMGRGRGGGWSSGGWGGGGGFGGGGGGFGGGGGGSSW